MAEQSISKKAKRQIFTYRWGTNEALWNGGKPAPEEALGYLRDYARKRRVPKQGWQVGPDNGRRPMYSQEIVAGDILIFYAGKKFTKDSGVYGVALAGTAEAEDSSLLAIPEGERRLKFRWLVTKELADSPLTGYEDLFGPPGPASTLYRINWMPSKLLRLVDDALRAKGAKPLGQRFRKSVRPLKRDVDKLQELPEAERVRVVREVRQVLRSALLRPRVCKLWGYACAACGLELSDGKGHYECEVAHICEVKEDGKDLISNSLPLCRTHHWAFDQNLWCIRPDNLRIEVRNDLRSHPALRDLHGKKLTRPTGASRVKALKAVNIAMRWERYRTQSAEVHAKH